jgi:hypothetical protein
MNLHGKRTRLGGMLAAAAAALAMLALPGLASSHTDHHDLAGDAGTIQSFDPATGVLTIDLIEGGSASGLVVRRTHVQCGDDNGHHHGLRGEDQRGRGGASASHEGSGRGNSGSDSGNSGRGEEPDEDDHGQGEEPGEDTPGHDETPPGSSENPGQGAEHHNGRCTDEDLVAGATVRVADLVLIDGKAIFAFVGLEPPEEAPAT